MTSRSHLALAAAVMALASSSALADLGDMPDYVRVRSLAYGGSGCPAGTVASNTSPDGQAVEMLFTGMYAQSTPDSPITERRRACQINLDLDYPPGWTFAVVGANLVGHVTLDEGASATQVTSLYFQGQAQTTRIATPFYGPLDQDYATADAGGAISDAVWAPCGAQRSLNINIQVRASSGAGSSAYISVDTASGLGGLQLQWRRCDFGGVGVGAFSRR